MKTRRSYYVEIGNIVYIKEGNNMLTAKINREMTTEELKELVLLMENQETTDRFKSTNICILGDYAKLEVCIDEEGNVTVL